MQESFEHLTMSTHRSGNPVVVTDTAQALEQLSARAIRLARLATSHHLFQAANQPLQNADQIGGYIESNAIQELGS